MLLSAWTELTWGGRAAQTLAGWNTLTKDPCLTLLTRAGLGFSGYTNIYWPICTYKMFRRLELVRGNWSSLEMIKIWNMVYNSPLDGTWGPWFLCTYSWGRRFISNSRKHLRDSNKEKIYQKKKSYLGDSLWFPYFACLDLKYATLPWSRLPSAQYRASFLPSIRLLRRSHWQPNMTSRLICPWDTLPGGSPAYCPLPIDDGPHSVTFRSYSPSAVSTY